MSLKLKISENFSKAASNYDEHALLQKQIAENLVLHSGEYLSPDARILDIGSGTGFIARSINRKITQADIAIGMCKKSSEFSPAICADFENLPLKDKSFDAIFSSSSMQWLENPDKTFAEVYRILDKSGYFFFTSFGSATLKELKSSQKSLNITSKIHKFHEQDELKAALRKIGFQVISYEKEQNVQRYDSTRELLKSIKNIGANTSFLSGQAITKSNLIRLENFYKSNYSGQENIYSTWEVLYFICQK